MTNSKKNIPGILIAFSIIIITEIMFFAGIISAYLIANSKAKNWPPIGQPRLPLSVTLTNMLVLLASGYFMYRFVKHLKEQKNKNTYLYIAILLGIIFLIVQGFEWVKLINFGALNSDGLYASYFYSIIALHGFHVLVGLLLLLLFNFKFKNYFLQKIQTARAFSMFWGFVCLLWPILHFLLYIY